MSDPPRNGFWQKITAIGAIAAVVISCSGIFVAWGANSTRLSDVAQRLDQQSQDMRQMAAQIIGDEKALAVTQAQYAEIIRRLDNIEREDGIEDPQPQRREVRP